MVIFRMALPSMNTRRISLTAKETQKMEAYQVAELRQRTNNGHYTTRSTQVTSTSGKDEPGKLKQEPLSSAK